MNAVVAVMAAHRFANLSTSVIAGIVGVTDAGVSGWVRKRNIPDGAYVDAIEARLAPMVKAHIDAKRMEILADLGSEYGERVKKSVEHPAYGTRNNNVNGRRIAYERRGTKFTNTTMAAKADLIRKVRWIRSEMAQDDQCVVAAKMGVHATTLSGWMSGKTSPSLTQAARIDALYSSVKARKKEMLKDAGVTQPEAPKPVAPPPPPALPPTSTIAANIIRAQMASEKPNMLIRVGADGAEMTVRSGVTLLIEDGKYLNLQEMGTHTFRLTLPNNLSVRLNK